MNSMKITSTVVSTFAGILIVTMGAVFLMASLSVPFPGRYQVIKVTDSAFCIRFDTWTGKTQVGTFGRDWLTVGEKDIQKKVDLLSRIGTAKTWKEIESDPDYKGMESAEQTKLKRKFLQKVVAIDSDYQNLAREDKQKLIGDFLGISIK